MKVYGLRRKSTIHENRTEHYDFYEDQWYCQPFDERSVTGSRIEAELVQGREGGKVYELELRIVPKEE